MTTARISFFAMARIMLYFTCTQVLSRIRYMYKHILYIHNTKCIHIKYDTMNKLRDYWVICGFMIMFGTITIFLCIRITAFVLAKVNPIYMYIYVVEY